ncbi:MAG: hypothetical protein U5L07_14625 [Desulfobacterales bacterium]|nr:hypothetical protein [Desulfobacterales bacterium]
MQQQSWSLLWMRTAPDRYSLLDLGGNQLLLGSQSRGVWRSADNGATWTYSSEGMSSYGYVRSIGVALAQPETLYAGLYGHGVWRTLDDGKTWEEINQGFDVDENRGISIRTLAVDPFDSNHLIAGTETTGGEASFLYYTVNSGQNWTKIDQGPEATVDSILFVSGAPGIILAGTLGDAIWRSSDNGLSFSRVADPDTFRNIKAFGQEKGGRIFAGLIAGFERINGYAYSDDYGATWNPVEGEPGAASALAADPHKAGHIMFGSGSAWMDSGAGVFFSNNDGSSWDPVNEGIPYGSIYSPTYDAVDRIIAHPQTSGTYYLLMDSVGVFKTFNDGASWQQAGAWEGNARGSALEFSPRKGGTLFLGTSSSGVFFMNESALLPGVLMLLLDE